MLERQALSFELECPRVEDYLPGSRIHDTIFMEMDVGVIAQIEVTLEVEENELKWLLTSFSSL